LVGLAFSRGLIPNPLITLPFSVAAQILFVMINDVSTVAGVLSMSIGVSAVMMMFYIIYLTIYLGKSSAKSLA
jgi:hypothetical protein